MLVTDVVTGKYVEEAQPLKLQPASVEKKIKKFYPPKKLQSAQVKKNNQF